jgi:hypothetical protein
MQDDNKILPHEKKEKLSPEYFIAIQEEYHRLFSENAELKKNLEKEQFLHQNLYRQWAELNSRTLNKDRELQQLKSKTLIRPTPYKYAFYSLLVISAVFVYFLFTKGQKNTVLPQTLKAGKDTISKATSQAQPQQSLPAAYITPEKTDSNQALQKELANASETEATPPPKSENNKSLGEFRVKVKTFFYNAPDENSRRNTFLLPYKDRYGIIKALDDKNDFIYIVYTNHAGRTSKGWIRKTDLDPIHR